MEGRRRTVWIVVIIAALGVLLCCCVVVAGAAVAGLVTTLPLIREVDLRRVQDRTEQVFSVGEDPRLEVASFAGDVTVRRGESRQIHIIITKRAMNSDGLSRIDVEVTERDDRVRIRTSHPGLNANLSVALEIFVPSETQLDLDTGAGNVQVDDVRGEISAHSGAGNVRVRGASASVSLDSGAGNVDYDGQPRGACTFETGAGNITLRLPGDANVEVTLTTGIGSINLGGFEVEGETSRTDIEGVIGSGEQATIRAETGAGDINLIHH